MTKDSDLQVSPSRRPTRERIGLIVNGTNAAAAIKTIDAAETAGVQQIWMTNTPWFPETTDNTCSSSNKNIYRTLRNGYYTNVSTSSCSPSTRGSCAS